MFNDIHPRLVVRATLWSHGFGTQKNLVRRKNAPCIVFTNFNFNTVGFPLKMNRLNMIEKYANIRFSP